MELADKTKLGRSLVAVPLVLSLVLARHAHAEPEHTESDANDGKSAPATDTRSPEVTLRGGAIFPMFLIYEFPGPLAGVTVGWQLGRHFQLTARGSSCIACRLRPVFPARPKSRTLETERGRSERQRCA